MGFQLRYGFMIFVPVFVHQNYRRHAETPHCGWYANGMRRANLSTTSL